MPLKIVLPNLDETWTVTVNGQSVNVDPNGFFKIPNIPATDQFGAGGPGTAPDFLSDEFFSCDWNKFTRREDEVRF